MALRLPKAELSTALRDGMIQHLGVVPEPAGVMAHNPKVLQASLELGGKVSEWDAADEGLKSFAHMAVAAQVGCSWCLDYGYLQAQNRLAAGVSARGRCGYVNLRSRGRYRERGERPLAQARIRLKA